MSFLRVSFAQMKVILVLMKVYSPSETNVDTNEWIFSVNEQQETFLE